VYPVDTEVERGGEIVNTSALCEGCEKTNNCSTWKKKNWGGEKNQLFLWKNTKPPQKKMGQEPRFSGEITPPRPGGKCGTAPGGGKVEKKNNGCWRSFGESRGGEWGLPGFETKKLPSRGVEKKKRLKNIIQPPTWKNIRWQGGGGKGRAISTCQNCGGGLKKTLNLRYFAPPFKEKATHRGDKQGEASPAQGESRNPSGGQKDTRTHSQSACPKTRRRGRKGGPR